MTATLIFSGIAGATIAAGVLAYYWSDLRRVAAEIDRESEHGFDLAAERAPLCVDCQHCTIFAGLHTCRRRPEVRSLIDGTTSRPLASCQMERAFAAECGPGARYFVARRKSVSIFSRAVSAWRAAR